MDILGSLTAVFLLYSLLERMPNFQRATNQVRWIASAAFAALLLFYLAWVGSYFRPETLPTAGLAALMFWLWSRWEHESATAAHSAYLIVGLLAATALQACIRADVPLALNIGMATGYLLPRRRGSVPQRFAKIATAVACTAVAGATQLYIMRIVYPHASYGPIPILMIGHDLQQPLTFPPFVCFMLPVVWTLVQFWAGRSNRVRKATNDGLMIGSLLYLLMWVVLGKLDEVRIFIPFAAAMTPLTVDLLLRRIAPSSQGEGMHGIEIHNGVSKGEA
jgi:hypothetical protein